MELTSKKYWQDYYEASSEDRESIIKVCSNYDTFWEMLMRSTSTPPKSILEIGAFPGRYMAYLALRYNLQATGLDFNPDEEKFKRSMYAFGVTDFQYICADFIQHKPTQQFDLVISNGFIEHFTNYDEVLDKHAAYLKKGGSMLVMIPNKRFLRSLYGNLVDRKNQQAHNLKCMKLSVFKDFASRNKLTINYLDYIGGFPFKVHAPLNLFQKLIYHGVRFLSLRFQSVIKKYPGRWWSSTIICVCHSE